ncbi:ragulator complex protein LAMTOR4 [Vespula squamosa]|uniref:Late endosomal/lysosomal adaptor and MAPK and MTOR activator 4 n=1 Tax=Vespula squamosa TaxID=30214 RepID=A0ABD1ZU10_VESSQ
MLSIERIPDQIGYLVLTEDGASGGDLENDERIASVIVGLVMLTNKIDPKAFPIGEGFEKISITYPDHCYIICLSNKKIYVVKKKLLPEKSIEPQQFIDI